MNTTDLIEQLMREEKYEVGDLDARARHIARKSTDLSQKERVKFANSQFGHLNPDLAFDPSVPVRAAFAKNSLQSLHIAEQMLAKETDPKVARRIFRWSPLNVDFLVSYAATIVANPSHKLYPQAAELCEALAKRRHMPPKKEWQWKDLFTPLNGRQLEATFGLWLQVRNPDVHTDAETFVNHPNMTLPVFKLAKKYNLIPPYVEMYDPKEAAQDAASCDVSELYNYATFKEQTVRAKVFARPDTPADLLVEHGVHDRSKLVRTNVAKHPNLPETAREDMARHDDDIEVAGTAARYMKNTAFVVKFAEGKIRTEKITGTQGNLDFSLTRTLLQNRDLSDEQIAATLTAIARQNPNVLDEPRWASRNVAEEIQAALGHPNCGPQTVVVCSMSADERAHTMVTKKVDDFDEALQNETVAAILFHRDTKMYDWAMEHPLTDDDVRDIVQTAR